MFDIVCLCRIFALIFHIHHSREIFTVTLRWWCEHINLNIHIVIWNIWQPQNGKTRANMIVGLSELIKKKIYTIFHHYPDCESFASKGFSKWVCLSKSIAHKLNRYELLNESYRNATIQNNFQYFVEVFHYMHRNWNAWHVCSVTVIASQ